MNLQFYRCDICEKVITVLFDTGIPTDCCGQPMEELVPNRTDGAAEKHVPVIHKEEDTVFVKVGSEPHPMLNNHSILWIGLRTAQGFQFKKLNPGDLPEAAFSICAGDRAEAAYAFCDIHGLWCAEL